MQSIIPLCFLHFGKMRLFAPGWRAINKGVFQRVGRILPPDEPGGSARHFRLRLTGHSVPGITLALPAGGSAAMTAPEILVVDDSQIIRLFLKTVLPRHGFVVSEAADGEEALGIYRRRRDDLRLVLLDVHMPGMDGPHTLARLRQVNPAVRCCFMSADAGDYSEEDLLALGGVAFLPKPFTSPAAVARTLREALGDTPNGADGTSTPATI
jgi:CheY-like chemotaxis protein